VQRPPSSRLKFKKKTIFPSGCPTLECFVATLPTGRLVRVGETFNRFADFGLQIAQNAFGGRTLPGPAGGAATALPQTPSRYKGREGGTGPGTPEFL